MQNGTAIQLFHWYTPDDGQYWNEVNKMASDLAAMGITAVWLPPACKAAAGGVSTGYDVYDLYDLGEFDQKGTVRTKYGTVEEYIQAVQSLKEAGIQVIVDIVLNHKGGGDETENVMAVKVNPHNRNEVISEPSEIEAFTKFYFPGRNGKYSAFIWDHQCFSGVDYDHRTGETDIFSLLHEWGHDWEELPDDEMGNYDYLMYNDIEFRNPAVREELSNWGKWYHERIQFDGVRLDAVKHISPKFYNEWLTRLRAETGKEIFAVGEYWAPGDINRLHRYLDSTEGNMSLFDTALHYNFHQASAAGNCYDMATILQNTLVSTAPTKAVTIVENHDTQPLQSLEAPVEPWFKPLAYALILLRQEGYPCIFYPDLFGAHYVDVGRDGNEHEIFMPEITELKDLLIARRSFAYGMQRDYFDHGNCIGWIREGDEEHAGCAVVLSNGEAGIKQMEMGKRYAGKQFVDMLQKRPEKIVIDENGMADFLCNAGSVSVWVMSDN